MQEHAEKLNALRRGLSLSRFNKQNRLGKKTLKRLHEVAAAPQLNRKCITQRNKRSQKEPRFFFFADLRAVTALKEATRNFLRRTVVYSSFPSFFFLTQPYKKKKIKKKNPKRKTCQTRAEEAVKKNEAVTARKEATHNFLRRTVIFFLPPFF